MQHLTACSFAAPCLFNVGTGNDMAEYHDVAAAEPEIVERLLARFHSYDSEYHPDSAPLPAQTEARCNAVLNNGGFTSPWLHLANRNTVPLKSDDASGSRLAGSVTRPLDLSGSICDASTLAGDEWVSSWWRSTTPTRADPYAYTFTSLNATHFSVTSNSPHAGWWHRGPALGVLDADFASTGRLTIHFLEGTPQINAWITNQSACALGRAEIWLENKSVWCQGLKPGTMLCGTGKRPPEPPPPPPIKRVFIVFSTHLDVGYTINNNGSCAAAVVNRWFEQLPTAIATAEQFRQKHPQWRFQWMIHSWIASMLRHCTASPVNIAGPGYPSDLVCPSAASLSAFRAGVKAGDIAWHAFPFNGEPETFDASLFSAALNLTFDEDDFYGLAHKITLSQRDVPGLTRGAIPVLARAGVKGVSVGENPSVTPVNVPNIFLWRDNSSGTEVIALFHKRGYGGCFNCGRRRRRRLQPGDFGGPQPADSDHGHGHGASAVADSDRLLRQGGNPLLHASDCVENVDSQTAICYSWRSDNSGPHTYPEALQIFSDAQRIYPEANVTSINAFDEFVRAVEPHKAKLALVTAELGDTWIGGASSDPLKVALFRSASRQRARCIATDSCEPPSDSPSFKNFERLLVKVGEHTWGWNGGDTRAGGWSNAEFAAERKTDAQYSTVVKTWQEQRAFILNAVAALPGGSSLRAAITAEWEQLRPTAFNESGFERVSASSDFSCGSISIGFDAATGGIRSLRGPGGTEWASSTAQLAQPWYQNEGFNYTRLPVLDTKPGLNLRGLNSNATITALWRKVGAAQTTFKLTMTMTDGDVHLVRGAPALLEALVQVPHAPEGNATGSSSSSAAIEISYALQWFNKTATKAPETIWLRNTPAATRDAAAWRIHKLGAMINPLDADLSVGAGDASKHCDPMHADGRSGQTCGVHLHAIDSGAFYSGSEGKLALKSLDSMLISVGEPLPSPAPFVVPDPLGGVHFSLVANTWNTNYPEWYPFIEADSATAFPGGEGDENSRFRFVISIT